MDIPLGRLMDIHNRQRPPLIPDDVNERAWKIYVLAYKEAFDTIGSGDFAFDPGRFHYHAMVKLYW